MLYVLCLFVNGGVKNFCDKFKVKIKNYIEYDLMVFNYELFECDWDYFVVVECCGLIFNSCMYVVVLCFFDCFFNF